MTLNLDLIHAQAIQALGRRDGATALHVLKPVQDAGLATAATELALGYAHALQGETPLALLHAERCLLSEPQNIRALLLKADLFARSGDTSSAVAFYGAAVRVGQSQELSVGIQPEVQRAEAFLQAYQETMAHRLESKLIQAQEHLGHRSERFAQALDILLGRRQIYQQQPRQFYFPGLPQIQFHDRSLFPWIDTLEAASEDIRSELMQLLPDSAAFRPYVERDLRRPALNDGGLLGSDSWRAHYLWKNGELVSENAQRCPKTMEALSRIPMPRVPGRSPSALFSMMKPGAHIPAHNGFVNTRLIGHLALLVPDGCAFRVGNETREWVEGKAWVFDDTIEHEAWNRSDRTRVVLIFDVWPPALEAHERTLVGELFTELEKASGFRPEDWND